MTQISAQLAKAQAAYSRGDMAAAETICSDILKHAPDTPEALVFLGRVALSKNDLQSARLHFERLIQLRPSDPLVHDNLGDLYAELAQPEKSLHHRLKAVQTGRKYGRFYLKAGAALLDAGRRDEAVQVWSLGADIDPAVRLLWNNPNAPQTLRDASRRADTELRKGLTAHHDAVMTAQSNPQRVRSSLWPQTHAGRVDFKAENFHPYMYYAPDLPPDFIFEMENFAGTDHLQSRWQTIRDEYIAAIQSPQNSARPYVHGDSGLGEDWEKLRGTQNWTSLHLYQDGQRQAAADLCPQTLEALEAVNLVHLRGAPMEVFFSILQPGTHIPPHTGLANTRVTAHLPLIIPDDAAIRVHTHTHVWTPGELFLFDDSWDHEAWNKSDEVRVVLIFEAWRPDMTGSETDAVEAAFIARQNWLDSRKIPDQ